jgi:hypothetical protein
MNLKLVCRRLAEDGNLRAKHQPLYALLDGMHGRVSLPNPSPEAVRSAKALLREAGASYSPVHSLLKVGSCICLFRLHPFVLLPLIGALLALPYGFEGKSCCANGVEVTSASS